jgi:hypothetical protein
MHTLTFVTFKGNYRNLGEHKITSYEFEAIPDHLLECKNHYTYEGVTTNISETDTISLMELFKTKEQELEETLSNYATICLLVNDTVLFLDMLCNSNCYADHPGVEISKAYVIRDELDSIFPNKKLTYLKQSKEWFKKQEAYYVEREENMKKLNLQLELLHLINQEKKKDSNLATP